MKTYAFSPARVRRTPDGERFRIGRLADVTDGTTVDLSHLLDRTYDYTSARELRWHLAERFGLPVRSIALARA